MTLHLSPDLWRLAQAEAKARQTGLTICLTQLLDVVLRDLARERASPGAFLAGSRAWYGCCGCCHGAGPVALVDGAKSTDMALVRCYPCSTRTAWCKSGHPVKR